MFRGEKAGTDHLFDTYPLTSAAMAARQRARPEFRVYNAPEVP